MSFVEMLSTVRRDMGLSQKQLASALGISPQYMNDLERRRKNPSVAVVERICDYMGRGPLGRAEWHRAGAIANGWQLSPPSPSLEKADR